MSPSHSHVWWICADLRQKPPHPQSECERQNCGSRKPEIMHFHLFKREVVRHCLQMEGAMSHRLISQALYGARHQRCRPLLHCVVLHSEVGLDQGGGRGRDRGGSTHWKKRKKYQFSFSCLHTYS